MIENKVRVRIHHIPNEELINELLSKCFGHDEAMKQYFMQGLNSTNQICTISAIDGEAVLGIAVAWKRAFHPYCTYISIAANSLFHEEVKYKLLETIERYVDNSIPLQTSIWETAFGLKSFYENNQFKEIRRTYRSDLQISNVPEREVIINIIEKITVKSFTEIYNNEDLRRNLITLVKNTYQKTHIVNPLGVHDLKTWEKLVFGEDTILKGSYIAMKGDEIEAFSMLHFSDAPEKLEFGWRGTKEHLDEHVIILLTSYQIDYAKQHNFTFIEAEVDTTDPYSLTMLKYFPFAPSPAFITYQKKIINSGESYDNN